MTPQEFSLLLMSVLASVGGQFFLKLGAIKLGKVSASNALGHILSIITIPELIGGLAFYGIGALTYILLLTRVNLSIAAPSGSLIYVFSVMLGYFFFKEAIPPSRLFGLSFIMLGVILVVWKK
ncbi:MAG: EamA family transporter [Pseudanabaena sp. M135S2SP2A07QC]|uniref:EamA family transporter n=1 Tax=Microcystis sp. M158S2 TaxID=2771152 RepID=UPI0025871EBE|nr:EamA family transporter [Microcystis sp. M158S2]MCA6534554.1 EamA family transporter [Pseudanabaena sp. M176S2SP2A07QC]MCA6537263.1 EamA family transporter [Pseudanabaena sp. M037S2SP2A07QC]MCA6548967.1 EamA family transporter [Pseudanabaena sp. M152S2SP2A07QC]MCA6553360.1 EamA family transporter [Pseudanabaena sp. M135S2SP2A07QC]MCA6564868.1 EamA family transporter [Pseudanabaena sp. M151S2SP2A07QC]MCA6571202.1 EamA family transporter [Pseudanabaena sp. M065S1SP2A07QC]MCA6579773.1 EamA f